MTANSGISRAKVPLKLILLAGFCGGLAEVLWVMAYGSFAAVNATDVARQVTASVVPAAASLASAPLLGVTIHLLLSLLLGLAFVWLAWIPVFERFGLRGAQVSAVAVLTAVWACNFFVVLPVLNPEFAALMPLGATFVSKALFGIVMAAVLQTGIKTPEGETAAIRAV